VAVVGWRRVTRRRWQLVDETGRVLRTVVAREPYANEPDGTKYVVGGKGYDMTAHASLQEAQAAAMESLPTE
jgi:hypothetical protein